LISILSAPPFELAMKGPSLFHLEVFKLWRKVQDRLPALRKLGPFFRRRKTGAGIIELEPLCA